MNRARAARLLAAVLLAGLALPAVARDAGAPAGDWPRYTRDMGGTRFSPLAQINTANVKTLGVAWQFLVRPEGGGAIVGGTTPIAVEGVLYLPVGNAVVAIEGESGKEIWRFGLAPGGLSRRGVAYWPGDAGHSPRIVFSSGSHLVALDAKTGAKVTGFGVDGEVDMGVPYQSPPTIWKNVLIVGANVAEMPRGPSGDTRAFDAVTGRKLWEFHNVPQPGEPGHETWLDDGWKERSGTNVWVWYMTLDPERGILYMPVGGPSPNYYGGDRPGANLYGNSLVAVDAETGKLRWAFQTIHHDLWDSDLPAPPVLVDVRVGGKVIPALAETGKAGYMYVLDRVTGKPVFGVVEQPVAKGDVPGEWYSPTQPIPVKPAALSRKVWDKSDIVTEADTNSEHVAACQALLAKYGGDFYNAGPFTPFLLHKDGDAPRASINLPHNGGSNWGGEAADPRTGLVYVNTSEGGAIGWIEKRKEGADYGRGTAGSTQLYDRGSLNGPGAYAAFQAPFHTPDGRSVMTPCIRPPWGRLLAVNANTGEIAWASRLGVTDDLAPGKQDTGRLNTFGGPIVTAGGLVFIGATDDRRFRAFDAKTGAELWTEKLAHNAQSTPITYRGKDGRQYVAVIAAGWIDLFTKPGQKPVNDEALIAFALPKK